MARGTLTLEARIRMMVEGASQVSSQIQAVANSINRLAASARAGAVSVSPIVAEQFRTAEAVGTAGEAYLTLMDNIVKLRRTHIPTLKQAVVDTSILVGRLGELWPTIFEPSLPTMRGMEMLSGQTLDFAFSLGKMIQSLEIASLALSNKFPNNIQVAQEALRDAINQFPKFSDVFGKSGQRIFQDLNRMIERLSAERIPAQTARSVTKGVERVLSTVKGVFTPFTQEMIQSFEVGIPAQMAELSRALVPLQAALRQRLANVMGGAGEAMRQEVNRQFRAIRRTMNSIMQTAPELARAMREALSFQLDPYDERSVQAFNQLMGHISGTASVLRRNMMLLGRQVQGFVDTAKNIDRALAPLERPYLISVMRAFGDALIEVTRQTWPIHQLQMALQMTGTTLIWMGGAAIGAVYGLSLLAQNFERMLRAAVIAADIPERLIEPFRDQILGLSEAFGIAPQAASSAITLWLRATGEVVESEEDIARFADRIRGAMALAAISGEDLMAIIPPIVQAVGQFGLAMDQMDRIMAGMYRVAKATAASVTEVGDSLRFVGPVAAQAGDDLETVLAALELAARAGLRGGIAGRALRQFYIQLTELTERAQDLNLLLFGKRQPFFDERGFVGLERAIEMIERATRDLTAEQRNYYLSTISTANELPFLVTMVEMQARFQEYAARHGLQNANVIRAATQYFRDQLNPEAELFAQFMRDVYQTQLDTRTAMEMFARDQERFLQSTATRWDQASRRIEQSVLRIGRAFREAVLPNLEKASTLFDVFSKAIEQSNFAARLASALLASGLVMIIAGAIMRGIGVGIRMALSQFIFTESLAMLAGVIWGDAAKIAVERAFAAALRIGPLRIGVQPFLIGGALGGLTAAMMGGGWVETLAASILGGLAMALAPQLVSLVARSISRGIMAGVSAATPAMAALSSMISAAVSSGVLAGIPAALSRVGRIAIPAVLVATTAVAVPSDQGPLLHQALFPEEYRRAAALPPGPERERAFRLLGEMAMMAQRLGIQTERQWRALMEQFAQMSADAGYQAYRAGERMALNVARGLQEGLSRSETAYQAYRAGERLSTTATLEFQMLPAIKEVLPLFGRLFDMEVEFQRNRERVIADATRAALRAEEDYARRRRRLLEELQRAREGDPEEEADRARRRERELREFYRRLADLDEDHRRRMLQMEEDHRDRVLDLVAERNALALVREMRDYEKRRQREEEEYQIRRNRMIRDFNERMALEEEENRLRRERRVRDLMERLREMDEEHRIEMERRRQDLAERLALMEEQFREERRQLLRQIVMRVYARQLEEQMIQALRGRTLQSLLASLDPVYRQILEEEMRRLQFIEDMVRQITESESEGEENRVDAVNKGIQLRLNRTIEGMTGEVSNVSQGHQRRLQATQQGVMQEVQIVAQGGNQMAHLTFSSTIEMFRSWMDYFNRLMNLQASYFGFSLEGWNQYLERIRRMIDELLRRGGGGGGSRPGGPTPYQWGGYAVEGLALLHAGEYVIPADAVRAIERALGGPITPFRLVAAVSSGGTTVTVPVSVQVVSRGEPVDIRQIAREVSDRVMRELSRSLR